MNTTNDSTPTPAETKNIGNTEKRRLKGIGHILKPIVIIGNNGLSDAVIEEINRALDDHELVKIKTPSGSKEDRENFGKELATKTGSQLIHHIGRMALLLRRNPNANPKLSNLIRHNPSQQ